MAKIRKLGDILLDMEQLIDEMADNELQLGDVLNLVRGHIEIHRPDMIEVYEDDNSSPIFYYGPKENK